MQLSRRKLIKAASGVVLCSGILPVISHAATNSTLPIPPLLESNRGHPLFLSLQHSTWSLSAKHKISALGFNGMYPGPTIRIRNGEYAKLVFNNKLEFPVSMTLAGLKVPAAVIGNPARMMAPNTSWSPILPIRQSAATCWYYANTPGKTGEQVHSGLVGMLLVEDNESEHFNLPNRYGVDDIPLILQDKRFSFSGELEYNPPNSGGFLGNTLLVNGVEASVMNISAGWLRLRLLNASNSRRYILQFDNKQTFKIIANDLGLLTAPVDTNRVSLAPGERKEILVNTISSEGKQLSLITNTQVVLMERLKSLFTPAADLTSNKVVTFRVNNINFAATAIEYDKFYDLAPKLIAANQEPRQIVLNHNPASINGQPWLRRRIDIYVEQGAVERWIVRTSVPQSFHVQGAEFLLQSRDGKPVSLDEQGWKDTVWIDEQIEMLIRFNQTSNERYPFLFGSQVLEYADRGALGQMVVTPLRNFSGS